MGAWSRSLALVFVLVWLGGCDVVVDRGGGGPAGVSCEQDGNGQLIYDPWVETELDPEYGFKVYTVYAWMGGKIRKAFTV
jgi:hypothetical protein